MAKNPILLSLVRTVSTLLFLLNEDFHIPISGFISLMANKTLPPEHILPKISIQLECIENFCSVIIFVRQIPYIIHWVDSNSVF